jgi:hypothetical protein
MRHDSTNCNDGVLWGEPTKDRPGRSDVSSETLDDLILRARRMRAVATAELLSRLGAALVRPFRHWTAANPVGGHTVIKGGPQRAI